MCFVFLTEDSQFKLSMNIRKPCLLAANLITNSHIQLAESIHSTVPSQLSRINGSTDLKVDYMISDVSEAKWLKGWLLNTGMAIYYENTWETRVCRPETLQSAIYLQQRYDMRWLEGATNCSWAGRRGRTKIVVDTTMIVLETSIRGLMAMCCRMGTSYQTS